VHGGWGGGRARGVQCLKGECMGYVELRMEGECIAREEVGKCMDHP
jgi:hypothetical protein